MREEIIKILMPQALEVRCDDRIDLGRRADQIISLIESKLDEVKGVSLNGRNATIEYIKQSLKH